MSPDGGGRRARRVVVIDDEPEIGELIAAAARRLGFACTATAGTDEFRLALAVPADLVVVDLMLPGVDGIELLRQLANEGFRARVVLTSGFDRRVLGTAEELAQSLGLDVAGRLVKPFRIAEAEALLAGALAHAVPHRAMHGVAEPLGEADLREAIEHDRLVLHYQPQIDMASGRMIGAEALARLSLPARGLVYPDAFIAGAEALGVIDALTVLVLKRAIAEFGAVCLSRGASVSVNVSALSLTDVSFPDRLLALADAGGLAPSSLVVEITESGLIEELTTALDILARLRMKGFKLSIDDFGTGYSSMAQIRRVPANELKIDRGFVKDMLTDESARAIATNSIHLAHELGMVVVAEGVETREQAEALHARGCDVGQGYLYSRPVPCADLEAWLGSRRRE